MKLKELISKVNDISPFFLQESYDNSGLQFGDLNTDVTKVLLSLEVTKSCVEAAKENNANVILAHHPILFFSTKRIVKQNMPVLFDAITSKINLVAAHTNFDIAEGGLNDYVGNLLEIKKERPIQLSAEKFYKFAVYVPAEYADKIREALFNAGAGKIGNYSDSSFNIPGIGTFRPLKGAHPFIGRRGKRSSVEEVKIETVVPERFLDKILRAMKSVHPYEYPAYDVYELKTINTKNGIGLVGIMDKEFSLNDFASFVRQKLQARYVRFIGDETTRVQKIALCTGAGSSILDSVRNANVDLFITGDIGYHTAIRAKEIGVNILDVEHFDTEKFFVNAMYKSLIENGLEPNLLMKYNKAISPYKLMG